VVIFLIYIESGSNYIILTRFHIISDCIIQKVFLSILQGVWEWYSVGKVIVYLFISKPKTYFFVKPKLNLRRVNFFLIYKNRWCIAVDHIGPPVNHDNGWSELQRVYGGARWSTAMLRCWPTITPRFPNI